ncbi:MULTISPECIES: hypothetical protein [Streptomyces]|uniref:hypothetical protein n=1 Tax=Streptomyces TaxID=1883 RepID=UPI001380108B|nr:MULTISPECIES: hypothetical protein [Streptomyces]MYS53812.1 hypothetical protein [Streptomyces sp. SID6013]GHB06521.1 hypothetical protein GCM10010330_70910 [Streptomyces tendae]
MTGSAPATAASPRICPNCDGFAAVAVSSGDRDASGQLPTLAVDCPACHGAGTLPASVAQFAGGRA